MCEIKQYDIFQNENNLPYIRLINNTEIEEPLSNSIEDQMFAFNEYLLLGDLESEHQYVIARDSSEEIKGIYLLGVGNVKSVDMSRRNLVLFLALIGAYDFYMIHNHPNGALEPSENDIISAACTKACGEMIEIPCVGDYIVTSNGWIETNETEPHYYYE